MPVVAFTLSEDGVNTLQNALACILKFSDDVSIEAMKDRLIFTAMNLSKSAFVSFTFAANRFFSKYSFEGSPQYRDRFFCSMYIRALLSVFRSRIGGDPSRERDKETTIERCDVVIDDGPGKKSRLIAKIVCRNGMVATHGLPFEVKAPSRAKFDKNEAINRWTISARTLRQLMEHFGPKIELLDINTDGDSVVNLTCFTENQFVKNEDFLHKPLHTSISVDIDEFDVLEVENKLHIIISVKDFRAILHHACATSGELSAAYSNPGRPMKLSYNGDGLLCEFVLITVGEKGTTGQRTKKGRGKALKNHGAGLEAAASRAPSMADEEAPQAPQEAPAPPAPSPARASARRHPLFDIRPSPVAPPSTLRQESLFVSQDDDNQWEPMNPDEEEDEMENARLEWDASNQPAQSGPRMSFNTQPEPRDGQSAQVDSFPTGLEPTQQLSEVRKYGLFSA